MVGWPVFLRRLRAQCANFMNERKLWVDLIVPCAATLLLLVDLYFAVFAGRTAMIRHGGFVCFAETPTIFVVTVTVKILVLGFLLAYIKDLVRDV